MLLTEIVAELQLSCFTSLPAEPVQVTCGYASDLLSDVMGNAPTGALWVTMQCHPNVAAVASLLSLAGVIIVGKVSPDEVTLRRAQEAGVVLLHSELSTFETVGRLYELGVRGLPRHD